MIPNNITLDKAYENIDYMFSKWFSKRKITFNDVKQYYDNIETFKPIDLLAGMLWMYYNKPIDVLVNAFPRIKGQKQFKKANLTFVNCFLKEAKVVNREKILEKISHNKITSDDLNFLINNDTLVWNSILKEYPDHPFADIRILKMLKERTSKIDIDTNLFTLLEIKASEYKEKYEVKKEEERQKLDEQINNEMEKNRKIRNAHQFVEQIIMKAKNDIPTIPKTMPKDEIFESYDSKLWF